MNNVRGFVHSLVMRAQEESNIFPIDREIIIPHINEILAFDQKDFLFYNFELESSLYTCRLFVCLPELWQRITLDDLLEVSERFTKTYSYFVLIEFTYKYLEVDIIQLILQTNKVQDDKEYKREILEYLKRQWNVLIKSEADFEDYDDGFLDVKYEDWLYIKQLFLLDTRVKPAFNDFQKLHQYIKEIIFLNS